MILIISDNDDYSTNDVIDWLIFKRKDFCRINRTDLFDLQYLSLHDENFDFEIISSDKKITVQFTSLTSYWYRRGYINLNFKSILYTSQSEIDDNIFYQMLNNYLVKENEIVVNCLYELIYKLNGFGKFDENDTNKLVNLIVAKEVGLKIPETMVSKQKEILLDFFNASDDELITKSLNQTGGLFWRNQLMYGLTKVVSLDEIKKMKCNWVTYLQNKINKSYEIRVFYLDRKIFASAIFSQSNEKTSVDFRGYDNTKRNRVVPYTLPVNIEKRIIEFMEKIRMKSGSIDLIVDRNNDYVFLEVNPIGLFTQISIPCNYYIEEYIANYLTYGKN